MLPGGDFVLHNVSNTEKLNQLISAELCWINASVPAPHLLIFAFHRCMSASFIMF